jgi:hypothetical protein
MGRFKSSHGAIAVAALIVGTRIIWLLAISVLGLAAWLAFQQRKEREAERNLDDEDTECSEGNEWMAGALQILPAAVALRYLFRGTYFHTGWMVLAVLSVAVACGAIYGLLSKPGTRETAWRWMSLMACAAAAASVLAYVMEPSERRFLGYLAEGELVLAQEELKVLDENVEEKSLWDELYVHQALAAKRCDEVRAKLGPMSANTSRRAEVEARVDMLAESESLAALGSGSSDGAERALSCALPGFLDGSRGRQVLARIRHEAAQGCLRTHDWDCAMANVGRAIELGSAESAATREQVLMALRGEIDAAPERVRASKELEKRLELERTALELWARHLMSSSAKEPPSVMSLRAALRRDEAAEAKEQGRARRAAWREAPLLCSDGSSSPSCTCGGSRSGCCSHHGGVDGCSAD